MSDLVVEHPEVRYGDLIGVADVSMRIEEGPDRCVAAPTAPEKPPRSTQLPGLGPGIERPRHLVRRRDIRATLLSGCGQGIGFVA